MKKVTISTNIQIHEEYVNEVKETKKTKIENSLKRSGQKNLEVKSKSVKKRGLNKTNHPVILEDVLNGLYAEYQNNKATPNNFIENMLLTLVNILDDNLNIRRLNEKEYAIFKKNKVEAYIYVVSNQKYINGAWFKANNLLETPTNKKGKMKYVLVATNTRLGLYTTASKLLHTVDFKNKNVTNLENLKIILKVLMGQLVISKINETYAKKECLEDIYKDVERNNYKIVEKYIVNKGITEDIINDIIKEVASNVNKNIKVA